MTSCPSWAVSQAPGLAILLRHAGAEESAVTQSVQARRHGMIQWAPKGSYRLVHVLSYLKWAVRDGLAVPDQPESREPACEDAEARVRARAAAGQPSEARQLVVVLDWFAPTFG